MEKVKYLTKEFVDFNGVSRIVTSCAVYDNDFGGQILLGYSVQNPKDEFDAKMGEKIAYSRALSGDNAVEAYHNGILIENFDKIAEMHMDYLINNPGIMIKGYNKKREKFLADKKNKAIVDSMTEEKKVELIALAQATPRDIEMAKKLIRYVH